MNSNIAYIVEGTVTLVVLFWVVSHNTEFGTVANAVANATVGSVRTLWGPPPR